jgi:DNA-binding MarR family transcriptional regulator
MSQALAEVDERSADTPDERMIMRLSQVDGASLPPHSGTTGSKLVCLYLSVVGKATMDELNQTLDMQRLRLYPMLSSLEAEGLVERDGDTFRSLPRRTN